MSVFRRLCIVLTFATTLDYISAVETGDSAIQQLAERLNAVEEQGKVQQHQILDLESLVLVHQEQDTVQQSRIEKLEARVLAQEQQNAIQQRRIVELESRDQDQQKIIADLKAVIHHAVQQDKDSILPSPLATELHLDQQQDPLASNTDEHQDIVIPRDVKDSSTQDHRIQQNVRRQQPEVANVAFTAVLLNSRNDRGLNQNVVFDHVETNIGGAYNPHHGVFTAPIPGTYVFHVTVFALYNAETWCKIMVNGVNKVDVYARGEAASHDQGSQTLVVKLNRGDDVAIQNGRAHDNVYADSDTWTTFSGFLQHADGEVNTIIG